MVQDSSAILSAGTARVEHHKGAIVDQGIAKATFGFSPRDLRKYHQRGCLILGGERLFGVKIPRRRKDGRPMETWFWLESQLKRLREGLNQETPESVVIRGRRHIPVAVAARLLSVGLTTICRWVTQGCPHLMNCRRLKSEWKRVAVPSSNWRRTTKLLRFVLVDDVDEIAGVLCADLHEYDHPRGHVVSQQLASTRYQVSIIALKRWRTVGCPAMGGKKLAWVGPRHHVGGGKFGKTPLYYYFERDLDEIRRKLNADPRNGKDDLLTLDEAAAEIGVPLSIVKNWPYQGCCWLGGSNMPLVPLKGSFGTGGYRSRLFVKRDVVDAILAARNGNGASETPGILDAAHKPAETASDAGNGSPSGTHGDGERAAEHGEATAQGRPSARGRKIETDVDEDRRIFEAWQTGCHGTKDDLARELGKPTKHVKAAIDRHRHRVGCPTLALEKMP